MVSSKKSRHQFINEFLNIIKEYNLDGIDYNWEYPGFTFETGYDKDKLLDEDYSNFQYLLKLTKLKFKKFRKTDPLNKRLTISLAYYPDKKQEK
eukprot:UN27757